MKPRYKTLLFVGVVGCIAFALYLPRFIQDRNTAAQRALLHNLEQIHATTLQWTIATNSTLVHTNGMP